MKNERRNFLKGALATCSLLIGDKLFASSEKIITPFHNSISDELNRFETSNRAKGMPIKATFLDEVSWDIPHQNWGVKE